MSNIRPTIRMVPMALAALLATAAVLSPPASAQAEPGALQSRATDGASSGNVLVNPSFEVQTSPWVGTRLTRVLTLRAPQGDWAARVSNYKGRVSIDDWPGEVTDSVQGTMYTASMRLATSGAASRLRPVNLVVREHDQAGNWVSSQSVTTVLRWRFQRLTVSLSAARSGDVIDMYASQADVSARSSFLADDASLVATPPPPPPNDAPSTLGLLAYAAGQPDAMGDTSRYAYVVLQENQYAHIAAIKQANPNTKVLAYMNTNVRYRDSCADTTDPHLPGESYGVNYCWADLVHPDWFLTDRSGNRLHLADYPFAMPLDVGNTAFANVWAAGTYANVAADGFDGVWMDDVNVNPGHGLNGRIAKYTDEQYGAATTQFTSIVGDYLRSHGMIAIANVGMAPWIGYQLADTLALGQHLTAVNREHWARYGDICGPFGERFNTTATHGTPPLATMMSYAAQLQAAGTGITGVDYGNTTASADDEQTMTYGRALFLLTWDGSAGSAYFYRRCGANDTASSQWTVELGLPTGPVVQSADGVLTRAYERGEVLLNPNRSTGASVNTVYVAPQTAAILLSS